MYAAEDDVVEHVGRRLRRWVEVEAFIERVVTDPAYLDEFPDAPIEIELSRRSRSARSSVALPEHAAILIRDGSWNAVTVLHELAHLVNPAPAPHGADFVATELALVRRFCGFHAYAELRAAFVRHGVDIGERPLASRQAPD